jgi:prepilin peptidase CpaA
MELLRLGILVAVLIIATYTDLSRRKIYNWATFPAIGLGIGFAFGEVIFAETWQLALPCLVGISLSLILFGIPYWLNCVGGGDLKLMIAVGALQGAPFGYLFILHIFYNVALVGAIMAVLLLIWRGQFLQGLRGSLRLITHPKISEAEISEDNSLPYGVAIAIGTLWTIGQALA